MGPLPLRFYACRKAAGSAWTKQFTPAQLLRHEAGLPDYGALAAYHADVAAGRSPWPIEKLMAAVEVDRLRYEPGHGWA
jgi:CubicO group peptidase (beta-lactamase class C family)